MFPLPSVTVHVTVVFPKGNEDGASLVTLATLQLSADVAVPKLIPVAAHPVFIFALISTGAVIVGLTVSVTVTI